MDEEETVSQFVDDIAVATLFIKESLEAIIYELNKFKDNTGLAANFDKTRIFRIGALKDTNKKFKTSENFIWANADIDLLGVILDDETKGENQYMKIINKMYTITRIWRQRGLSLKGKICVANSLLGSLLVYQMQMSPAITNNNAAKINRILEEFIWSGRKTKNKNKNTSM